jgi:hypothetical protein
MDTTSFSEIAGQDIFKNLPLEDKKIAAEIYWDDYAKAKPEQAGNVAKLKQFSLDYLDKEDRVADTDKVERRLRLVDRDEAAIVMGLAESKLRGEFESPEAFQSTFDKYSQQIEEERSQVNKSYEAWKPENRDLVTEAAKAALNAGVFGEQALRPAMGMSFPGAQIPTTTSADEALRQQYDNARKNLSDRFNLEPYEADDLVKHQLGLQKEPVSRDVFGQIHFKDDLLARSTSDIKKAVQDSSLPDRVKKETLADLGNRVTGYKKSIIDEAAQYHKELAADIKLNPKGDTEKEYKKITDALQETRLGQTGGGLAGYALGKLGSLGGAIAGAPGYVAGPMGGMTTPPIEGKELEQVKESMQAPAKKQESINALSERINQEKVRIFGTNAAVVGQGIGSALESIAIGALTGGLGTAVISADRIAKAGKFGQVALGFGQRALNTAPVAGYFGAGQALDTYESAIKAGKTSLEAAKLAATSGAVEFGVTTLFGGVKLGGLEDIGQRLANPEVRRQLAKTVGRSWREFGFGAAKGLAGEVSEEMTITALDTILAQSQINPNLTVEDLKKSVYDTLVATLFSAGPLTTLTAGREQGMDLFRPTMGEFIPTDVSPEQRQIDALLDNAEQAAPEAAAAAKAVADAAPATVLGAEGQPISQEAPSLPPPAGFETTPPTIPLPTDVTTAPTEEVISEVSTPEGVVTPPSLERVGEVAEADTEAPTEGTPAVADEATKRVAQVVGAASYQLDATKQSELADQLESLKGKTAAEVKQSLVSSGVAEGMDTAALGFLAEETSKNGDVVVSRLRENARLNAEKEASKAEKTPEETAAETIRDNEATIARLEAAPGITTKSRKSLITGEVEEVPLSEDQIKEAADRRAAFIQILKDENAELSATLTAPIPPTPPVEGAPIEGAPVEGEAAPAAPAPITPEAQQLIASVDAGGVPMSVTPNLERIAAENGVPVSGSTRPMDIVEALRQKISPTPQPDATQERTIEESGQPERETADEGGTPTETGGGDLTQSRGEEQKEDEVTAENLRKAQPSLTPEQAEVAAKVFKTVAPDIGGSLRLGAPPTRDGETLEQRTEAAQKNFAPETPEETKAFEKASANKVTARSPELAVAAVRLANGQITSGDYADLVDQLDPFEIKGGESIPSDAKIKTYIASDRVGKVNSPIPEGKEVEFRIDIPTYNRSTAAGDTVYAVTAHEPAPDTAKRVGETISYVGVARVSNPRMMTRAISGKGQAIEIAEGAGKFPLATVKGNNVPITELPENIGDPSIWTEVAYNPIRSSFFVDVRSKQAVTGGDEAIMVGSRVFVRNPTLQPRPRGFQTGDQVLYQEASRQSPESKRHAELEAKFNAGTITPEETAEAEKIVEGKMKAAGLVKVIRSFPDGIKPKDIKPGDWVSLDTKDGRDYQEDYAGRDWEKNSTSAYLNKAKTEDRQTGWANGQTLIVLEDAIIKSADPFTGVPLDLRQTEGQDVQGRITFAADMGTAWVELMDIAKPTTFYHELAHFLRRFVLDENVPLAMEAAARRGITRQEIQDLATWAGVKDGKWTRKNEEKFARAFEKYLLDGKAPNAGLQEMFGKISSWMKEIYTSVTGSEVDIEITDTVRKIFDKLFTGPTSRTLATPIFGTTGSKVVGYSWDENGSVSFTVQDELGTESQVSRGDLQATIDPKGSKAKAALNEFARKAQRNAVALSRGQNQSFSDEDMDAVGQEASTEADTPATIIRREDLAIKKLNESVSTLKQKAAEATRKGNPEDAALLNQQAATSKAELDKRRAALKAYKSDNPTTPAPSLTPTQQGIYDKVRNNPSFPVINALLDISDKIKRKAFNEKNSDYNGYIPIGGLKGLGTSSNGRAVATELLRRIYSGDSRTGLTPDKALQDSGIASDDSIDAKTPDEMWGLLDAELKRVADEKTYDEGNPDEVASPENIAKAENLNTKDTQQREAFDNAIEYGEVEVDLETLNEGDRLLINGVVVEVTVVSRTTSDILDEVDYILVDGGEAYGVRFVYAADGLKIDSNGYVSKDDFENGRYSDEIRDVIESQEHEREVAAWREDVQEFARQVQTEANNAPQISLANGKTVEPLEYNEENRKIFEAIEDVSARTEFLARMLASMLDKAKEPLDTKEIDYSMDEEFNPEDYFSLQERVAEKLLKEAGFPTPDKDARRDFGVLYDAVMSAEVNWKKNNNPGTAGTRLLNSLIDGKDQTRVLRDVEIAHLTLEGITRRDAMNRRSAELLQLVNTDRTNSEFDAELEAAENALAMATAAYNEILSYAAVARSQSGRSLNAWKFAIKDDYTYASVFSREFTARSAARRKADPKAKFEFSPEDLASIKEYSEKQVALQDQLKATADALLKNGNARNEWMQNDSETANTIRQLQDTILKMEAEKAKGSRRGKLTQKVQESLKAKADAARARRASKKGTNFNMPVFGINQDVAEAIEDFAAIGASWFVDNALITLDQFTARLKKEGSALADAFVGVIYSGAKKNYNAEMRKLAGEEGRSSAEIIEELDPDDTPTRGMVFDLARAFIREGKRDFEVLNSVTDAMQSAFRDLTREDVAILFTNYGKGESVIPTEFQSALATSKSLERAIQQLGSLQKGEAPKRSQNMVQKEISPKLLDLKTQIQNLQKKMRYDQRDESQELASAHSKARNRMKNIIAAKRKALEEGKALESTRKGDIGNIPPENLALQGELAQVNEEYNNAFGALTPEEVVRRQKLAAHNTAENWIGKMIDVQTDTQAWDVKADREPSLQKLITDHVGEANPNFQADAVAFGVTEEQARVMDALANHERKSRETFKETKKRQQKDEAAERENARRRPGAVAAALIKRFSERQLDSSQIKRDSKPTSEVTLLTREHLKEANPDFVDVMVGLGATREQATELDALITAERNKITGERKISLKDRNEILEKSLDRQIQAEQDLINQGLVKAIEDGVQKPAESEAVLARRKALKDLRLLKYEMFEAANPGQLATDQALIDAKRAIMSRQETLQELESGLVAERKEKKDRTEGVNVTQELQDQWDTTDRLDVLITSLRRERAKLPDTPSQTSRKIEASLKMAETALARNEERIAKNDILPKQRQETPASKDARVKEVRGRNKELLNLIRDMQRDQQIGSFSEEARRARQLGSLTKILNELVEANRTRVYQPRKPKPKPIDDRDLDMIRFKIDENRQERDAWLAQKILDEMKGWEKAKEQMIAYLRFRQMFSLTGDAGGKNRQMGPFRFKFLRSDVTKLVNAVWDAEVRQDIRENGLVLQRWYTAIFKAARSAEGELEVYSNVINHPDYPRRAKKGYQVIKPGEYSAELGTSGTARINPMNLLPWWGIGIAATGKAILRAVVQYNIGGIANVKLFDFASTVAIGFGAKNIAKVLERMVRVSVNVGRWEVQDLLDQKSLAEKVFKWPRGEEYEKQTIRAMNTFSGRGTIENKTFGPAFEASVNLLSIASDFPRWRASRYLIGILQPLYVARFGWAKENRAAMYKVSEMYFDLIAGAALNHGITFMLFGLTPLTSLLIGLLKGEDGDDEEENRKKQEKIEKTTYLAHHYLDPKIGSMRVGDVYFDELSGTTRYASFIARALSKSKLDPALLEQGIYKEVPLTAYDKRKMLSDFLFSHVNNNVKFGLEAFVMREYRDGGPLESMAPEAAVLKSVDALTANLALRDMGKIMDKLGDIDGTLANAKLFWGTGVSPVETARERAVRIAKEKRLAAEYAARLRREQND